ncbi:hypothetical protein PIROE2DRAFT_11582 [Piromyces sp. E2]|nr:hypothetical protein PIROE2DRAFT_11582 [Piromyces sp. E2]|eukprot:OUM62215.1 hypothetical protein PIROE2DRAFT_11582 [Piromyces sp. E2]
MNNNNNNNSIDNNSNNINSNNNTNSPGEYIENHTPSISSSNKGKNVAADNVSIGSKRGQSIKFSASRKSTRTRRRNNVLRHKSRINRLVKQSNEIQNSYKTGFFEEVLNGPRGPDVRLHRHNIIVGLLKLILILCLTAGIVLLSVIMLCITINVGYVCVQIDSVNSVIQLLFFTFYFNAIYYITRSFWRTYLRSLHTIIDAHFGSSVYDIFVKRVLGYLFSMKIAEWTLPEKYESHPKDWYEKVNIVVFIIFLFLLALPILFIAIFFGYYKVTGMVCLLFVGGGAVAVVFLNIFSRFILFTKFFRRLDEFYYNAPFFVDVKERIDNQTSYLRLTYCTTNGLEGGEQPFNYVLELLIRMVITVGVAAVIFGSFDTDIIKISLVVILLVILVPIRYRAPLKRILVRMNLLSRDKMERNDETVKNKVNAEMDATHKKYIINKRASVLRNPTVKSTTNAEYVNVPGTTSEKKSGWDLIRNPHPGSSGVSQFNMNDTPDIIHINVESIDHTPSVNQHDINEINSDMKRITSDNHLNIPNFVNSPKSMDSSFVVVGNGTGNPNNVTAVNTEEVATNTTGTPFSSPTTNTTTSPPNVKIVAGDTDHDDSFYYLLQSDKSYIRRKTLLTWDIRTLISWRGCLTVFFSRCVKYITGVTFMALLNYFRYSVDSDETTTHSYLVVDIISHAIFLMVILSQDIVYLFPVGSEVFSMKLRKIIFMGLLFFEFILVIFMRVIITNGYIPMAFIVLAYANFNVYPDPRYTWDDEDVERKTFFDLFRPEINLRSEVSYQHIEKQKGILPNKQTRIRKVHHHNHKGYRPVSMASANSTSARSMDNSNVSINSAPASTSQEDNSHTYNNASNLSVNSQDYSNGGGGRACPSLNSRKLNSELGGLNEEEEVIFENFDDVPITERNTNDVFISVDKGKYEISRKFDAMTEFNKAIKNIKNEMQYKRNTRARYNSTAIMAVTAVIVFISVIIGIIFARSGQDKYTIEREVNILNVNTQKPAICQWRGDGISINEFASISCACYYSSVEDINYSWLYSRPQNSTNEFVIGDNTVGQSSGVQYVDFVNKEKNLIVVAIRGTTTVEDIFQDIYIWSASALLQVSGYFGTFVQFWPRDTIAALVRFMVKQFTNFQLLYWVDVEKHIKNLQDNTNSTIYLTGHSLGGGVAGVISAHLNIPAITFSSPGLGYSYKTYDIELKKLVNNFVNVVPMSDPVPLLDSQVGQIQNIECNSGQPLACHSIYNTIDTLGLMCQEKSVYRYWDHTVDATINGEEVPHKNNEFKQTINQAIK